MSIVRVQSRGQITIPRRIREACGIEPGSELLVYFEDALTFGCRVLPKPADLGEILERYTVDGPGVDVEALREEAAAEMGEEYLRSLEPEVAEGVGG